MATIKRSALTSLLLAGVAVIALAPDGAGAQQWSDQDQQYRQDGGFQQFGQGYPYQQQYGQYGQSDPQQFGQQNQPSGMNPYQQPTRSAFGEADRGGQYGSDAEIRMIQEADRNRDGAVDTREYIQYRWDVLRQANRGDYASYYDDAFQAYPRFQGSLRDDQFSMALQEGQAGRPPSYEPSAGGGYGRDQGRMEPFAQRDLNNDGDVDAEDYLRWHQQAMRQGYREYRQDLRAQPKMGLPYAMYGDDQGNRSPMPQDRTAEARQRAYLWSGEDRMQGQYSNRPGYGQSYGQGNYGQGEFDRFGRDYPQGSPPPYPQFGQAEGPGQYGSSNYGQPQYGANSQSASQFGEDNQGFGNPMDRLSERELRQSLRAQGYSEISSVTDKGYTYAVEANRDGQDLSLEVDARTGYVLNAWRG